jgi:hypothetical protein
MSDPVNAYEQQQADQALLEAILRDRPWLMSAYHNDAGFHAHVKQLLHNHLPALRRAIAATGYDNGASVGTNFTVTYIVELLGTEQEHAERAQHRRLLLKAAAYDRLPDPKDTP